jgi:tetratricopeptide (TPR) repeat protein
MAKFTTQRSTYVDPATGETKRIPKITGNLIRANADNPEAIYNLGTFYLQDKKYEKGLELLAKSLKLKDTKETRLNLATCYKFLGNHNKAQSIIRDSIRDYPSFSLNYNNLGLMLYDFRDIPEAIKLYEKALALRPDYGDAKWNMALALNLKYFTELELGKNPPIENFQKAMNYFDARFEKSSPVKIAHHEGKLWTGEKLGEGEKLWILCEQGVGDIIQFIRYAYCFPPDKVVLHIPTDLHFLIKKEYFVTNTTEFNNDKYWIPMMSLAKYFPITDSAYIDHCAVKNKNNNNFSIGIVWKGNPDHANDANRSRMMKDFLWLAEYGSLISLQKDGKIGNIDLIKQPKLNNWVTTVNVINSLDIVVTVDTSIAHLCGAMGVPCIILIPKIGIDWRWGEIGENCIWYSSVRFARMQSMSEVKRLISEFKINNCWLDKKRLEINVNELTAKEASELGV